MLNFYSSQIYLCNHFRYNEELNGRESQIKIDENLLNPTTHNRLPQISLRTSFACKAGSLKHKLTKRIDELDRKTPQNDKSLTKTFWSYNFYIAALNSLPAPRVIRKAIMTTTSHALDLMK